MVENENTNLEGPCEIKPLELEKTCKISNPTFNDTSREKPEPWGHQESSPKGTVTGWEDTAPSWARRGSAQMLRKFLHGKGWCCWNPHPWRGSNPSWGHGWSWQCWAQSQRGFAASGELNSPSPFCGSAPSSSSLRPRGCWPCSPLPGTPGSWRSHRNISGPLCCGGTQRELQQQLNPTHSHPCTFSSREWERLCVEKPNKSLFPTQLPRSWVVAAGKPSLPQSQALHGSRTRNHRGKGGAGGADNFLSHIAINILIFLRNLSSGL